MPIDGRNYIRNTILALEKIKKPFLIRGTLYLHTNPEVQYITIVNPRAYMLGPFCSERLCDHLNIFLSDEDLARFRTSEHKTGTMLYLAVYAKRYKDHKGIMRGGIYLADNLISSPVCTRKTKACGVDTIPKHLLLDWRSYEDGRYLWIQGQPTWINGHPITHSLKFSKYRKARNAAINEQRRKKKERSKENRKNRHLPVKKKRQQYLLEAMLSLNITDFNNTGFHMF